MRDFCPDYVTARARFRSAAIATGASLEALPIHATGPRGEVLTIDAARVGPADAARTVVVSSGLHGVEGYYGSAVQLQLLERRLPHAPLPEGVSVLLLHALNPFGMAWRRRVNEDNVDLNRNFLLPGAEYSGAPDGYAELDGLLNPPRPPSRISAFVPKAAFAIARQGMPALKNAVAGGQYAFPRGLFFGGSGPTETHRILEEAMPRWMHGCERALHIDFHTGLGEWATYKMFVDHPWDSDGLRTLSEAFGADVVEPWEPKKGASYAIRGGLGTWCKGLLPHMSYDVLAAEFGTHSALKVVQAMSRENRVWQHGDRESPQAEAERSRFCDVFVPPDPGWRERTLPQGLHIVDQAIRALA
jgi:hypothetical protein